MGGLHFSEEKGRRNGWLGGVVVGEKLRGEEGGETWLHQPELSEEFDEWIDEHGWRLEK